MATANSADGSALQQLSAQQRRQLPSATPQPGERDASGRVVLEDDEFAAGLDAIIQRDFYPDLPALRQHVALLDAAARGDLDAARVVDHRDRRILAAGPCVEETLLLHGAGGSAADHAAAPPVRLDTYVQHVISEDTASFDTLHRRDAAKHRARHPQLLLPAPLSRSAPSTATAVPLLAGATADADRGDDQGGGVGGGGDDDDDDDGTRGQRPRSSSATEPSVDRASAAAAAAAAAAGVRIPSEASRPESWAYRTHNALMHVPAGLPPSDKDAAAAETRVVQSVNTRFRKPLSRAPARPASPGTADSAAPRQGMRGVVASPTLADATPRVNGYAFVTTPDVTPSAYAIPATPERESLARRMVTSRSRPAADLPSRIGSSSSSIRHGRVRTSSRAASSRTGSAFPSASSARVSSLTPTARRLAARVLAASPQRQSRRRLSLQDVYGTPGVSTPLFPVSRSRSSARRSSSSSAS